MTYPVDADDVTITLARTEALVLFEWLHRLENEGQNASSAPVEQVALASLSALLERVLVEPFRGDYDAIIAAARARLAQEVEGE